MRDISRRRGVRGRLHGAEIANSAPPLVDLPQQLPLHLLLLLLASNEGGDVAQVQPGGHLQERLDVEVSRDNSSGGFVLVHVPGDVAGLNGEGKKLRTPTIG